MVEKLSPEEITQLKEIWSENRQLLLDDPYNYINFRPSECFLHLKPLRCIGRFFKYFLLHMIFFYFDVLVLPIFLLFLSRTELKNLKFICFKG
jgi:hypothetical protein